MGDIAGGLARYAIGLQAASLPALARARAVDAIVDCVGCMLVGSREPLAPRLLKVVASQPGGPGAALLVGTGLHSTPADAALYNGACAHALDYDDTNHPAYAHPSAAIVPALLAAGAVADASGEDAVTAYVLGLEVMGKLGRALNTAHYLRGWHATATFGTLAACAAAAKLLRLPEREFVMALGIAASAAGGLRANFGSEVKPLHAGYAARNGVLAALLAREGFEASEDALEHKYGYVGTFNDGLATDRDALKSWGEPLEILTEYGLALKPYPSCGATHTAIEAAILARAELGGEPIKRVRAGVSEMAFAPLIHVLPRAPLEGKFSLHYCVSAALVDGRVGLDTFTEAKVADPAIRDLVGRITMEADDRVRDGTEFPTVIEVETASGRRVEKLVPLAIGKPERWFSRAQLEDKFMDCAGRAQSESAARRAFDVLLAMDGGARVRDLQTALAA